MSEPKYYVELRSKTVSLWNLSALCMDWISGTPRHTRSTILLFEVVDGVGIVSSYVWETPFPRLNVSSDPVVHRFSPCFQLVREGLYNVNYLDEFKVLVFSQLAELLKERVGGDLEIKFQMGYTHTDGSTRYGDWVYED